MRRLKKHLKGSQTSGLVAGGLAVAALLAAPSAASGVTYHPTRTDDPSPNGCKKKNCSLREAVIAANANGGGKIVLRPDKRYVLSRKGSGEDAALTGDLDVYGLLEVTTKGRRGPMATIDANGIDRIFDGRPTDFGGGIQIVPPNSPTLDRVILRDGHARATAGDSGNGGAILGNPKVVDSHLVKNTADGRGGAIYFNRGPGEIDGSVLKGNAAASDGGALYFLQACQGPEGHLDLVASRAKRKKAGRIG